MGALHAGHSSLVRAAVEAGDAVVMSIFVNPRQFEDVGDLSSYPSTPEEDATVAEASGVDLLVRPSLQQMWPRYPEPTPTTVRVSGVSEPFEGEARPGHFDGVASVVAKLLTVTGPCRLYMGEKDFQQVAVVRQFVEDLGFAVDVRACPTVRDEDGLALSSRNRRLSAPGRVRALALSRVLQNLARDEWTPGAVRQRLRSVLSEADLPIEYADVVRPDTLEPWPDGSEGVGRILVAVRVDGVRLIDNGPVILVKGA
jgi:pantoate--beta-alanine ligase